MLSLQSAALSPRPSPLLGLKAVHLQPGRRLPEGLQPPQGWPGSLLWEGEPGLGVPQQAQKSHRVSAQVCGAFKIKTEVKSKLSARLKASSISSGCSP